MWVTQRQPQSRWEEKNLETKYREEEHRHGTSDSRLSLGLPLSPTSPFLGTNIPPASKPSPSFLCPPARSSLLKGSCCYSHLPPPLLEFRIRRAEIPPLDTAAGKNVHFLHKVFHYWVSPVSWAQSAPGAAGQTSRTQEVVVVGRAWSSFVPLEWQFISLTRSHTSPTSTPGLLPPTSGLGIVPSLHQGCGN